MLRQTLNPRRASFRHQRLYSQAESPLASISQGARSPFAPRRSGYTRKLANQSPRSWDEARSSMFLSPFLAVSIICLARSARVEGAQASSASALPDDLNLSQALLNAVVRI